MGSGGSVPSNVEENEDMNQEIKEMNQDDDEHVNVNVGGHDKNGNANVNEGDNAISEDGADVHEIQEDEEEVLVVEEIKEKKKKHGKESREGHSVRSRAHKQISEIEGQEVGFLNPEGT